VVEWRYIRSANQEVTLDSRVSPVRPRLNELRVDQRVSEGGHRVPVEKIAPRIERLHDLMIKAVAVADHVYLPDNSSASNPFKQVAEKHGTTVQAFDDPMPEWAGNILSM